MTAVAAGDGPFREWMLARGLVAQSALADWADRAGGTPLGALLAQHHAQVSLVSWCEALAAESDFPRCLPLGTPEALPPQDRDLLDLGICIIAEGSPTTPWLLGTVNPFCAAHAKAAAARVLGASHLDVICVPPHMAAAASARNGRDGAAPAPPVDWAAWGERIGLPGVRCQETFHAALFADAGCLALPQGLLPAGKAVDGVAEAAMVFLGRTCAWFASWSPDPDVRDRLLQATALRPIIFLCAPEEVSRLRDSGAGLRLGEGDDRDASTGLLDQWILPRDASEDGHGLRLWQQLLNAAVSAGASDIHLEPKEERFRVRLRVHGHLMDLPPLSLGAGEALVRRCKIQGGMLQAEKGRFQSGAGEFTDQQGRVWEQRYEVCVARQDGEAVVIRMLDRRLPSLDNLSLAQASRRALDWFLSGEGGMLVITGPTGSGKTTTLYACLSALDAPDTKIVTIEHPVEKRLEGAVQIDVREEGAVTFASALRSVVRQDPDVIMVGEIRDPDSARIAVQAALTGHLVLTTVHATDAAGVVERLGTSFGVDRAVLASSLRLVLAQRLVPILCPLCRRIEDAGSDDLRWFPSVDIARPVSGHRVGCPACRFTGIAGRTAIAELLVVDEAMSALLEQGASVGEIRAANRARGHAPLSAQAARMALSGELEMREARLFFHGFTGG